MSLYDKSFQALLLSLILHGILVLFLRFQPIRPSLMSQNETTEITILENNEDKPGTTIVPNLNVKPLQEKLKEQADFLSMFTQRVKQQMQARNAEKTVNTPSRGGALSGSESESATGAKATSQEKGETEVRRPGMARNLVLSSPSLANVLPGIRGGEITALNTDQFTYYSFYERLNEQVYQRWVRNLRKFQSQLSPSDYVQLSARDRTTQVEFVLNPQGEIIQTIVQRSAGFRELDEAAVLAFLDAAPFENPPRGMIEPDGNIRLQYSLTLTFSPNPFVGP